MTSSSRLAYDEADGWSTLLIIKDPIKSLFESYILIAPFVIARALFTTLTHPLTRKWFAPTKKRDERVGGGEKWVTHRSIYSRDDRASWCRPVCVPGHRSCIVCGAHTLWEKTDMKKTKKEKRKKKNNIPGNTSDRTCGGAGLWLRMETCIGDMLW